MNSTIQEVRLRASERLVVESIIDGGIEWYADELQKPERIDDALSAMMQFRAAQKQFVEDRATVVPALPLTGVIHLAAYRVLDATETTCKTLLDLGIPEQRAIIADVRRTIKVFEAFIDAAEDCPDCEMVSIEIGGE